MRGDADKRTGVLTKLLESARERLVAGFCSVGTVRHGGGPIPSRSPKTTTGLS